MKKENQEVFAIIQTAVGLGTCAISTFMISTKVSPLVLIPVGCGLLGLFGLVHLTDSK